MIADICIVIEGTYPYVAGGVSSWLHALITNMPDFTFTIVNLGSHPDPNRKQVFKLPENVLEVHDLFLHDTTWIQQRSTAKSAPEIWQSMREFHEALGVGKQYDSAQLIEQLHRQPQGALSVSDLFFDHQGWELLIERYNHSAPDSSFLDFFWTFRFTHLPLFYLLQAPLPPARLYHSPGTGYGGFLAALGKLRTGAPVLLTEHGIYNREREIEIAQAEWIYSQQQTGHKLSRRRGFFKEWWMNVFRYPTKFAYEQADAIISITGVNQRYQLEGGADPGKMMVIPNGIDLDRFGGLRQSLDRDPDQFSVGFVGRVVPIKDVKTFVRAIKIATEVIPNLVAYVVGPMEEDVDYFNECQQLVDLLELTTIVRFTGRVDVREYYRQIDVLVLTSLSEAQPLVILEGNCAGVPVVSSEVGACRELVMGETLEDQALGPGGILTPVASPAETANGIIQLWRDEELRQRMARAGQERVRRFYRQEDLYDAYRAVYRQHLDNSPVEQARVVR